MNFSYLSKGAKPFFSITLLLVFSSILFAQINDSQIRYTNTFFSTNENIGSKLRTRPRIYVAPEKKSVESSTSENKKGTNSAKTVSTLDLERQAFDLLNQRRIENGLKPVVWSEDVARIARVHSQNMARNNFFSHQGLDGLMVDDRADSLGVKNWRRIGENIAYNRGYENPVEFAVLRWMQSQTHRSNLLSDKWKESGVGVAIAPDGKTYYFTQVFMLRK